jgi:DNA-binding transcriptional MocR family regulator
MAQYSIHGRTARELVDSVERAVDRGELEPGQPLPSVRNLAKQVGLSPTTVAAAVAELRNRGTVVTRERSRSYVSWRPAATNAAPGPVIGADVRDLARGNPDPRLLPDLGAAIRDMPLPAQLYGGPAVVPELVELARERFASDRIDAGFAVITSGALDAIERALVVSLRPGDTVAVEDPGYAALFDLARALGLGLRPMMVDQEGPRPEQLDAALRAGARAAVVTPRAQNPTGAALTRRRAAQLRRVLARWPDTLLIEDDHLGEVSGADRHTTIGATGRWMAVRSAGKSLGPDVRVAMVAGDRDTIRRIQARQQLGPLWVSHILQRTALALWSNDEAQRCVEHAAAAYGARREALIAALDARGVAAVGSSGFNVWVPVPDEVAVLTDLLQRGWAVAAGAPYRLRADPAIRITVSEVDPSEAAALADAVAGALSPAPATRAA